MIKATELITVLTKLVEESGDLPVLINVDGHSRKIEELGWGTFNTYADVPYDDNETWEPFICIGSEIMSEEEHEPFVARPKDKKE